MDLYVWSTNLKNQQKDRVTVIVIITRTINMHLLISSIPAIGFLCIQHHYMMIRTLLRQEMQPLYFH